MLSTQDEKVIQTLFKLELVAPSKKNNENVKVENENVLSKKVGRNNTCPCGSGKKYKNCHGN